MLLIYHPGEHGHVVRGEGHGVDEMISENRNNKVNEKKTEITAQNRTEEAESIEEDAEVELDLKFWD